MIYLPHLYTVNKCLSLFKITSYIESNRLPASFLLGAGLYFLIVLMKIYLKYMTFIGLHHHVVLELFVIN